MTGTESGRLDDLPPSAKYVLDTVAREEPVTRQEIIDETGLRPRTVDRALETLQNVDFIVKTRDNDDLRQVVAKMSSMRRYNPSQD
ncbi:MarR family transcriptional regulator [Halomicroarcula sp. GCM10025709]|uniref:helix-turn-helix domain-containing protein n=1 Tax=Haloarcula TaxID=2237 RepID=UPI0024C2D1A1|nr:helix-turn-helix domain-containing protein [Halomicroarcula sp. YJ-61-S]